MLVEMLKEGGKVENKIHLAIMDDHQAIIDGYTYRLSDAPDIEIVAAIRYGDALGAMLAKNPVDVLLLDVHVPTSHTNPNPYPILHLIPKLLQLYPKLNILVISMHAQRSLIQAVMDSGASGYVLKDDQATIMELAGVIRIIAGGGVHLSQQAYQQLLKRGTGGLDQPLSTRQREALSLCAAYPNASTSEIANMMNIAHSTLRNILSGSYLKLSVRTRTAAVAKARQIGLITPVPPTPVVKR